jgi:hypothetical protein
MNEHNNTKTVPASISLHDLTNMFFDAPLLEAKSSLSKPRDEILSVADDYFALAGWEANPLDTHDREHVLLDIRTSDDPVREIEEKIESLEAARRTLEAVAGPLVDFMEEYRPNVARHDFIMAVENHTQFQSASTKEAVHAAARETGQHFSSSGDLDAVMADPDDQATIRIFLGEETPVLERTYGAAAKLVLERLDQAKAA